MSTYFSHIWWGFLLSKAWYLYKSVLYTDIDLELWNKLHGPMHHKIGVTSTYMCIQWTRVLYSVEITQQSNPPISQFSRLYKEFTIQCLQVNVPMHYFFLFLISHIYRQYTAVSGQCEQYWCHWSSTDIREHYLAIYIIPWVYKKVL